MPRPKPEHYVAPVDESATIVVDAPHLASRKSNLWLDAWRDLRKRPLLYVALAIVAVVLLMAIFPTIFTQVPPNDECYLANSNGAPEPGHPLGLDRKSTRLNSSHVRISYAVFCLKKKKKTQKE